MRGVSNKGEVDNIRHDVWGIESMVVAFFTDCVSGLDGPFLIVTTVKICTK